MPRQMKKARSLVTLDAILRHGGPMKASKEKRSKDNGKKQKELAEDESDQEISIIPDLFFDEIEQLFKKYNVQINEQEDNFGQIVYNTFITFDSKTGKFIQRLGK